jgi:hypothetical protein
MTMSLALLFLHFQPAKRHFVEWAGWRLGSRLSSGLRFSGLYGWCFGWC